MVVRGSQRDPTYPYVLVSLVSGFVVSPTVVVDPATLSYKLTLEGPKRYPPEVLRKTEEEELGKAVSSPFGSSLFGDPRIGCAIALPPNSFILNAIWAQG